MKIISSLVLIVAVLGGMISIGAIVGVWWMKPRAERVADAGYGRLQTAIGAAEKASNVVAEKTVAVEDSLSGAKSSSDALPLAMRNHATPSFVDGTRKAVTWTRQAIEMLNSVIGLLDEAPQSMHVSKVDLASLVKVEQRLDTLTTKLLDDLAPGGVNDDDAEKLAKSISAVMTDTRQAVTQLNSDLQLARVEAERSQYEVPGHFTYAGWLVSGIGGLLLIGQICLARSSWIALKTARSSQAAEPSHRRHG